MSKLLFVFMISMSVAAVAQANPPEDLYFCRSFNGSFHETTERVVHPVKIHFKVDERCETVDLTLKYSDGRAPFRISLRTDGKDSVVHDSGYGKSTFRAVWNKSGTTLRLLMSSDGSRGYQIQDWTLLMSPTQLIELAGVSEVDTPNFADLHIEKMRTYGRIQKQGN